MRPVVWIATFGVIVLVSGASPARLAQADGAPAAAAAFLTDPQLPPGLVASGAVVGTLDNGAKRYQVFRAGSSGNGTVVVPPDLGSVQAFEAPPPEFPVPDTQITNDAAIGAAKQFARKWRPELFAAGEVAATVDEEVTGVGGYYVHLRQKVDGTLTLTSADVQVRVYDGRIIAWESRHTPLALATGAKLTADQAQQAAAGKIPFQDNEPVMWLDRVNEIVEDKDGKQHNVWTVWAEIKTKNTKYKVLLESLAQWWIDAQDGTILKADAVKVTPELYFWYLGKGGTHVPEFGTPQPRPLFTDRAPAWSGDGKTVAFLSTRARPGYPGYLDLPYGLFMVDATGDNLRCVRPEETRWFALSPDGKQIAIPTKDKALAVLDATGEELATFTAEKGWFYDKAAWAAGGKLIAGVAQAGGPGYLVALNPANPQEAPVRLPVPFDKAFLGDSSLSPDGKTLAMSIMETQGFTWQLWSLPAGDLTAAPTKVTDKIPDGQDIQWLNAGTVLGIRLDRSTWLASEMFQVEMQTGKVSQWQLPGPMLDTGIKEPWGVKLAGLAIGPDGRQFVVASPVWDYNPKHRPATILYLCSTEGKDLKRLTPWGGDVETP